MIQYYNFYGVDIVRINTAFYLRLGRKVKKLRYL